MKRYCTVLAGLLCWALPLTGSASQISLIIKPTSFFRQGEVSVAVNITNKGDEPAMSVQVEAAVGGRSALGLMREQLAPGGTFQTTVALGDAPTPSGIHTIVLKIHYTDGRGYPFTAVSSIRVVSAVPDTEEEPLNARLKTSPTRRNNEVILTLATQTNLALKAHITLVLPAELRCATPELDVAIPPREEQKCRFLVENVSGLPGSTYAVLAVVDYMLNGQHRSITDMGSVSIKAPEPFPLATRITGVLLIIGLLIAFVILQFRGAPGGAGTWRSWLHESTADGLTARALLLDLAVLAVLLSFTLYFIPPKYLFLDTTCVGGDTPAHNYLASHLQDQLFHHGRIASWAGGWWCGFPMFQFYFCLPYLLTALLGIILPFNIAFKLVAVLGILILPASAYVSARWMRLPRPGPLLLAIAMIPFLFDDSHTMWGVNIFSTLAGMIANSLSFAIMLLAMGSAFRDTDDGQFRFRTVFLFVALMASHFFTSVVAGLTLVILPFLRPKAGLRKALLVLAAEGALALLLMAWWLIPLVTKQPFTAEFGTNWDLKLHCPPMHLLVGLALFALVGAILSFLKRDRFAPLMLGMLLISTFLLFFGFDISPVFVNVRLWPFIFFSLLALSVTGIALLVSGRRAVPLLLLAALLGALLLGTGTPQTIRSWARWNFEGLEKKPRWPVFAILVLPLDETPGRLANDLHPDNDSLGSTRVFELVPALIRKPVLEGGILSSAVGSLYSYYVQSETSKDCAGFPEIVKPTTFNFTNATRHLELFNVKHFIARWSETQAALARSPDWKKLNEVQGWQLYELTTHDGRYVSIPPNEPMAVRTSDFKLAGLEWIYTIGALEQPFVLLGPDDPAEARWGEVLSPAGYSDYLSALKKGEEPTVAFRPVEQHKNRITSEEVTDDRIRFRTTGIGLPHIVKCSYFPNWKVRGAKRVYLVTPDFMLVYPEQEEVELYYGYTLSDNVGRSLSALGLGILIALAGASWRRHRIRHHGPAT